MKSLMSRSFALFLSISTLVDPAYSFILVNSQSSTFRIGTSSSVETLFATQTLSAASAFVATPLSSAKVPAVRLISGDINEFHVQVTEVFSDPGNQWKPHSQQFSLIRGEHSVFGEIFWMFDHVYIRIGSRWVRFPSSKYPASDASSSEALAQLPWEELLSGPLLLGNPSIQQLMGHDIAIENIVKVLPDGAEIVVEKAGFTTSSYEKTQVSNAQTVLSKINLFVLFRENHLSADNLSNFLDAYILISGAGAGHEQLYDHARQQINFLIGAIQDKKVESLYGLSVEQLYLLRILGEKRQLGFNFITVDLVKELKSVVAEAVIPKGEVFILGKNGRVERADAINQGNLVPTANAPHIHDLQNDSKPGIFARFVVPFLMYGGNATRIRDTVFANKVTGYFFWMPKASADRLRELLQKHGFAGMAEVVQTAYGLYQVSMLHLLSLLMPPGIYLAGASSLVAGAEMVGAERQLVQDTAHQIDENGAVKPMTSELAGHGDSFKELLGSMSSIQESIQKGGVIILSNAEYYDPSMYESVSKQVVRGKNAVAIAVYPQTVNFVAPGFEALSVAFNKDPHVKVDFGNGLMTIKQINHDGQSIVFTDGRQFSFASHLDSVRGIWVHLREELEKANQVTDPKEQRDLIIDILHLFEEGIQKPLSAISLKIVAADGSETKVPAFRIDTQDGGMLSEVQGVVSFVEKSQFGATHDLHKSTGETYRVSRKTIEAIWFKDFNPQFFGWDSFAVKACLTQEAQNLYREFRTKLGALESDDDKIALRDEYAQKIYAASSDLTPEKWSQLVEMLDLLQSVLMVPPFEAKGKAGVDQYFKINKMAQQVMSFMVSISMSNLNMEDIDLKKIRVAVNALKNAQNEAERMAIRNSLTFGNGKTMNDLAQVVIPNGPSAAGLIRVETNQFVQVKKPEDTKEFSHAINRTLETLAPGVELIESSMASLTWAATGNMARDLLALGVLPEELALTIGWAAWHEALHEGHVNDPSDGMSTYTLMERHPNESLLLKEFRELVVQGLSKDHWFGWLAFGEKWKEASPRTAAKGDKVGQDFYEHPIYLYGSRSRSLPLRAA